MENKTINAPMLKQPSAIKVGKVIAVWGDGGLTTVATALASELAAMNKQILLINTSKVLPANAVWHITAPVSTEKSIGNLFHKREITSALIARYFAIDSKQQPNIATLAYCDSENILLEDEQAPYDIFVQMIKTAQSIVDYVIVDFAKSLSDMMALAGLQFADLQVIALTPDARGIQFFKSNMPLLSNEQFNQSARIFVANQVTNENDVPAFGDVIKQPITASLPVDIGVRKSVAFGEFLKVTKYTGHKYNKEIKKIINAVGKKG